MRNGSVALIAKIDKAAAIKRAGLRFRQEKINLKKKSNGLEMILINS